MQRLIFEYFLYFSILNKHKCVLLGSSMNAFNHFVVQFYCLLVRRIVLDVCHEIFFVHFPSSCLKSWHRKVYHNRVILMHTLLLIRFTSYRKSPLYLICIWVLKFELYICIWGLHAKFSMTLFWWFDCNPLGRFMIPTVRISKSF